MLRLLAEYFCLRTNDLPELRGKPGRTESARRSARRTLLLLYQQGLVARLPYLDLDNAAGGFTYVYGLSEPGVRHAAAHGHAGGTAKPFGEHSARTLDHELAITAFHRSLAKFAAANTLDLYWLQKDLKRTVHPDAVFALTDPSAPDDRNTRYYFLEIERAKAGGYRDGEPQIVRKLRAYARHWGTRACEKDWGDFREFTVIVVMRTEARRRNLNAAMGADVPPAIVVLTTEPACRSGIDAALFAITERGP